MALSSAAPDASDTAAQDASVFDAVRVPPLEGRQALASPIKHVTIEQRAPLSQILAETLQLPQQLFVELMRFGAVHYAPVMPKPVKRKNTNLEHLREIRAARRAGMQILGTDPKLSVMDRALADRVVTPGGYVRVYLQPKRFPEAYRADWKARVLHVSRSCVVVDKPAGVEVAPTVDNILECATACTASALRLPQGSLHGLSKMDTGISGVAMLGRGDPGFWYWFGNAVGEKPSLDDRAAAALVAYSKEARAADRQAHRVRLKAELRKFGEAGKKGKKGYGAALTTATATVAAAEEKARPKVLVRKVYRAVTMARPPLGPLVHYAHPNSKCRGKPPHMVMRKEGAAGSTRCEMEVLEVREITLSGAAAAEYGPTAFESDIRLMTAHTHQIRGQLAAEGCPVLGDLMYEAVAQDLQREKEGQQQQPQEQPQEQPQQQPQPQKQQQPQPQKQQQPQQQQQQQQQQAEEESEEDSEGEVELFENSEGDEEEGEVELLSALEDVGELWRRAAHADPLKPIGLQVARLSLFDPKHRTGVGPQHAQHARPAGWVEFVAGTPWWRAEGGDGGVSSSGASGGNDDANRPPV